MYYTFLVFIHIFSRALFQILLHRTQGHGPDGFQARTQRRNVHLSLHALFHQLLAQNIQLFRDAHTSDVWSLVG